MDKKKGQNELFFMLHMHHSVDFRQIQCEFADP